MREYAKRLAGIPALLNNVTMFPAKKVAKFSDFCGFPKECRKIEKLGKPSLFDQVIT